jgi:hypothetical protein
MSEQTRRKLNQIAKAYQQRKYDEAFAMEQAYREAGYIPAWLAQINSQLRKQEQKCETAH